MTCIERYWLFWKFLKLASQAKVIEKEWQRIQQDEHDFFFKFQVTRNGEVKEEFLYKKGVADGVKWCVERFS